MIPRPLTWLLVVLATVILPVAVLSSWTATMVEDTDRYVETVAPLADDPVVVRAAAQALTDVSLEALGPRFNKEPQVQVAVRRGVARVIGGPEFPPAWTKANRALHAELVRILSGEHVPPGEVVRIDLAPLADDVVAGLQAENLPIKVNLTGRDLTIELAPTDELEQARVGWDVVTTAGYWLPIIWGLLVLGAIITARRRLATLGQLAVGAALGFAAVWIALVVGKEIVLESTPELADTIWDTVFASLITTAQIGLVVSAVVLAVRIAIGLGRGRQTTVHQDPINQ